jgi:hypothetical protein
MEISTCRPDRHYEPPTEVRITGFFDFACRVPGQPAEKNDSFDCAWFEELISIEAFQNQC